MFDRQIRARVDEDRAVSHLRRRSVSGRRRRPDLLDPGRLHDLRPLSLFDGGGRQRQLHPQRGQDRRSTRITGSVTFYLAEPNDPIVADARARSSRRCFARCRDAGRPAAARALSGRHLQPAGGGVLDVPHDQPGGLLQQGRPVGGAGDRSRRRHGADGAVLHDHEAPGENRRRVHSDAAVHAAAARQPRVVDGGAQRRRRTTASCWCSSFPKQKLVFGPRQVVARINQDQVIAPQITLWNQQGSEVIQGTLMVIPDRGIADLRPAAVSARAGRAHPRADARHRRLPESDRDGAHARGRARADLRHAPPPPTLRARTSARLTHSAHLARPAHLSHLAHPATALHLAHPAHRRTCAPELATQARAAYERALAAQSRRLGEVRRGDQAARRDPRSHATPSHDPNGHVKVAWQCVHRRVAGRRCHG